VILVDDGSPDGCGAICDAYASQDPRVRAVHKSNGGLSSARNAGLHVAKGDVIAFVDSDDWVAPDFLEAMVSALEREGADIIECGVVKTAGDAADELAEGGSPSVALFAPEAALRELIRDGRFHQTVWNKLYRRAVLDGILFEVGRTNEDEFWTWQVFARAKRLAKIDRPLYYYFQRPGSIMGASYSLKRLDALDAKLARQSFLDENYPALAREARLNLAGTCLYSAQMSLKHLRGDELQAARKKIDDAFQKCRPSREDLASLSFKNALWQRLARVSFWGTARLKNLLKKGF
jgi:glycosyltransferase involved in cell wall biosynthesis